MIFADMHELYSTVSSMAVLDYFKLGYFDNLVKFIALKGPKHEIFVP